MTTRKPRYSKEEFARLGNEIYQHDIRPQVEAGNLGKIIAIDIETGGWEMDKNEILASNRLEARYPQAQIWIIKIGYPYVRRFGIGRIQNQI